MEDLSMLTTIFGSEELLQYSDELLETMAQLRGRRLNMDIKKVIELVNNFKIYRKKNNKKLKTKINIKHTKLLKVKREVNKCLKTCLTKKNNYDKKLPKNKTRRKKK